MYLGIDLGTSGVKAVMLDDAHKIVAQTNAALDVQRPEPLWSEQNPEAWWQATCDAVTGLPADLRKATKAIGLSGQMHGATLIGEDHRVLRPAILWNDGRSGAECADLEERVSELPQITGNRAMPGFTAPKLIWVKEHEPDIFRKTAKVLLPKDYVRLLMTGDYASDMSDAAGTLWLDVACRDWSDDILAACDMTRSHMPDLFEGSEVTGSLRSEIAKSWGVPEGTPVVGGGGDNAAGAVGMGVVKPGGAFLSLGTSGVLFVANQTFEPNAKSGVHTFCHALPGLWHQMSVMLSAASCLDWAANLTAASGAAELVSAAEASDGFTAKSPVFLPYLSGERTPHNDPNAKGVLFGLTHTSDRAAIGQAVLEGVALAFADGLEALSSVTDIQTINVIGGGARSAYWGRILAAALARPLVYRKYAEVGPALGASRLAQMAAEGGSEAQFAPPPIDTVVEPIAEDVSLMAEKLPRFRALYESTKDLL